jgi:hypothetical protein
MRTFVQQRIFALARFDQTAYTFCHNDDLRPVPPTRAGRFHFHRDRKMKKKAAPTRARKRAGRAVRDAAPAKKPRELPVDYMLRVMRDPDAEPARRDTMAKSATPYVHARPAAKKKALSKGEAALRRRLEVARETLARKLAALPSE